MAESAAGGRIRGLVVTTRADSDFWRTTSYGFLRDDRHALLIPLPAGRAAEVTFRAEFAVLYDQAGAGPRRRADVDQGGRGAALAGPYCCSPQREGLRVRISRFTVGPADIDLHTSSD